MKFQSIYKGSLPFEFAMIQFTEVVKFNAEREIVTGISKVTEEYTNEKFCKKWQSDRRI